MTHVVCPADEDLGQVADREEHSNQDTGIVEAELADKDCTHKGASGDDEDRETGEDGRCNDELVLPPLVLCVRVAGHVAVVVVVLECVNSCLIVCGFDRSCYSSNFLRVSCCVSNLPVPLRRPGVMVVNVECQPLRPAR